MSIFHENSIPEELYFDRETFEYARRWNDLTKRQLIAAIHVMYSGRSLYDKRARLVNIICEIGKNELLIITEGDAEEITNFFFDEDIDLTVNLLPSIRVGRFYFLYGPSARLSSSSFGEFMMADMFCQNYLETENAEWLHKMIACLYRPKKRNLNPKSPDYDGDIREKFNSNNLESRLRQIEKLDFTIKQAILLFFIGCKNHFAQNYKHIFVRGSGKSEGTWFNTLHHYAQSPTQFEKITDSRASLILFDLNETQLDAKKMQERIDRMKSG